MCTTLEGLSTFVTYRANDIFWKAVPYCNCNMCEAPSSGVGSGLKFFKSMARHGETGASHSPDLVWWWE